MENGEVVFAFIWTDLTGRNSRQKGSQMNSLFIVFFEVVLIFLKGSFF